jgi:hypothetical protein
MTEDQLQAALYLWTWNELPHSRRHLWAVPNGLHLPPILANKAKATGLLAGVWDLHAYWYGKFHIIETKIGTNQLTVDRIVNGKRVYGQKEWGDMMAGQGATRHIYRDLHAGQLIMRSIFGDQ